MIIFGRLADARARTTYHAKEKGYWYGDGVHALEGYHPGEETIVAEHLRSLLDGRHPITRESLLNHRRWDRIACLHLCITPSKSVSLAALAQMPEVTASVALEAHRVAVGEVMRQISRLARGRPLQGRLPTARGCV